GNDLVQVRGRHHGEADRAVAHALHVRDRVAELGIVVVLDLDRAVGQNGNLLGKKLFRVARWMLERLDPRQLGDDLRARGSGGQRGGKNYRDKYCPHGRSPQADRILLRLGEELPGSEKNLKPDSS